MLNKYSITEFTNFGKFRIRKNEIFHNNNNYYSDRFAMINKDLKLIPDSNLIKNNITESMEYNIKMIEKSFNNQNYQEVSPVYNVKVEYWENMIYFSNQLTWGLYQSRYCALTNNIKNKKYWIPEIDSNLPLIITNDKNEILVVIMKISNCEINQTVDNYYQDNLTK